jgi:ubiquitin carboxyl-terminal hydrolase 47
MAIENYIKPEILEGDNQYFCEKCDSKQDAKRGINLLKGPEILSIVLNRFTLDYSTFQRVKVTDRVTFPHLINLNNYLKGYENIAGKQYDKEVERMQLYQKDKV